MSGSTNYTVNIKALFDAGDALNKIKNIQTVLNNLKLPDNLRTNFNNTFNSLNKAIEEFQTKSAQGIKTKADSTAINKSFDKMTAEAEKFDAVVQKIRSQFGDQIDLSNWIKIDGSITQQINKLNKEINDLQQQLNSLNSSKLGDLEKILNNIKSKGAHGKGEAAIQLFNQNDLQGAIKLLDQAIAKQQTMLNSKVDDKGNTVYSFGEAARKTAQENIQYFTQMQEVFRQTAEEGSRIQESIDFKETEKLQVATQYAQQMTDGLNGAATASTGLVSNIHDVNNEFKDATNSAGQFVSEIGQIKSRIQYFFGLANAINLVKRAVRSSFNTVKELDKAMTETAVVTNYTIKDMWKQLPEYTKRANQLGVTTKAAYESATLYYQQGLNTEQAAALSTETLKMARIAGLDAADATDRMTNALRGFNMELNATQAQRVDDVYSQLAAMSASNVDEISTAMTKVASLAHNANMEFETTAAFLAQIIETTRESAETAGTALKTVVARFSEVKKLYDTDQLKGQDEEGQVIDVNKVSAALRTAGIDLNKYFLGEVGLDDIFMELSEKWDSLTNIQQRYIATQAAGSRQQSRFIALMQDYSRTQELVGAAYSSTGASQKQFEKTQDSMESKLARLKNAWDEFAMGLANNAVLKGAVDVLTNILQLINKITNAFGDGVGSIMKWGALIGSLVGVRGIFKNGGFIDKAAGSFLNNTTLGNILFKGGVLSGNLFGGATAAGSTARQAVEEAARQGTTGPTVVTGGGLLRNLFSRKAVAESLNEYQEAINQANLANGLANMKNFASGKPLATPQQPDISNVKGLARLGLRVNNSKLLGGVSKKLAGTKFASSLGKVLGFEGTNAAAAAAAGLATALGTVAAAAGAVAIAYKAWYDLSPEGQLKSATKWAETMDKVSENAEKAKNSTKEAYEGYQEKNKAVETADTAISRQKAISERNQFINDLLQKNNTYAQYLKTSFDNQTGELVLTIDEADMQKVAENAEAGAIKAAAGASLAQAMKAGTQANVYAAQMRRAGADIETKTITEQIEAGTITRAMTDAEIAKYTELQLKQSQEKATMEAYAKNAYARMVDSDKLSAEMADLVAGALAKTFDAKEYLKEIKDARNEASNVGAWWLRGREYWQEEYYKIYGTRADSSMKNADIASAVGEYKAQAEEEKKTAAVSKLAQQSQYEALFKALNGEVDIEIGEEIDKYIEKFNSQLDDLVKESGINKDIWVNTLKTNAKLAKDVQKSNLETLSTKGIKAGAKAKTLQTLLGANKEDIAKIINFSDAAEKSLGEGFGKFLDDIPQYIKEGQLDNLNEFFRSFDLDNPISAFKKLHKIASDATDPMQDLANTILSTNKATLLDKGYLTQVFMTSEAYEGINESLDKFIEDNGKITSQNIKDLAENCSDLKTLIDDAGISTKALAIAFTSVGKGKASIEGISTSILNVLTNSSNLSSMLEGMFEDISNFDPGRDFGEGTDFIISKLDDLKKYIDGFEFGNEITKNLYDKIFGEDAFKNLSKGKTNAQIQEAALAEIERVRALADYNSYGFMKLAADSRWNGVSYNGSDYDFIWDIGTQTTDDLVSAIQSFVNVSEDTAKQLLAGYVAQSPEIQYVLNENEFKAGVENLRKEYEKQKVLTEQELEVFAAQYDKTVDDIKDYAESNGIELPFIVSWQEDGQNLSGDELIKRFKKIKDAAADVLKQGYTSGGSSQGGGLYNADTMLQTLISDYKVSEEQARQIANNLVQGVNGQFTKTIRIPVEVEPGKWEIDDVKIDADSIEDLEAEVKLKEDQAQWTQMGQAMAQAVIDGLGTIDINSEINIPDNVNTIVQDAQGKVTGVIHIPSVIDPPSNSNSSNVTSGHYNEFLGEYEGNAAGGYVSYASGSRKIKPGIALTGEEGPELVWNKEGGYAYLAGENGPEFNNLRSGDQIFPADETKRIFARRKTPSLANGGKVIPSYASTSAKYNPDLIGDGKNKGSGDNKDDEFKMDLDKYYNMVEDINELLRLRNLLETDYNQLLKVEGKTGKEIYDNLTKQLDLLEQRYKITEDLAEKRKQQIIDLVAENQELSKYAWWNNEDLTIEIDWDLVNGITDKEEGNKVKDYLSKLEDFQSKYDDMIENLEDIESAIQDIKKRGQKEYQSLEDRTRDALIKQIQDKIDELSDVDKAISDTNQKLFDSINETLQLQRQERTNAETESELIDKEKRLAYLQQDSSNANQLEIAKLQKEIDDARQDYTDNLIDQKISELQRQNDEAADQRQQQIDLMQRSLDWQEKSGAFWQETYRLISEGTSAIGALVPSSELERLLKQGEAWDTLSDEGKMDWLKTLEDQVAQGIAYLEQSRQLEDLGTKEGTQISFTNAKGERLTGTVDSEGNVVVKNSNGSTTTYKDVFQDYYGNYRTFEGEGETKVTSKPATSTASITTTTKASTGAGPRSESNISSNDELEYFYEAEDEFDHWVYYRKKGATKWSNKGLEGHKFINGICSKCKYTKQISTSSEASKSNIETTESFNSSVNKQPDIHELNQTGVKKLAITKYSYVNDSTCRKVKIYTDGTSSSNNGAHDISRTNGMVFCKNCGHVFGTPEANAKQASGGSVAGFELTREENSGFSLNGLIKRYATGGLNTHTGIAWLDGTANAPELVLNARDTENFIELKDTLTSLKSSGGLNFNGGDNYYDIKVQVDSLGSDYDVDKAIDRIKARIAQDGAYRNVNTLSRLR